MLLKFSGLLLFVFNHYFVNVASLDCSNYEEKQRLFTDSGANITLQCRQDIKDTSKKSIYWVRHGVQHGGEEVINGSLQFTNISLHKTGCYACYDGDTDEELARWYLIVRGVPVAPTNLRVHASTVVAVLTWHYDLDEDWENNDEGPKTTLHLVYKEKDKPSWLPILRNIGPNQGQMDIYHLKPDTTYVFRLWAENKYGNSSYAEITTTTRSSIDDEELAKKLLASSENFSPNAWLRAVVCVLLVMNLFGGTLLIIYCKEYGASLPMPDLKRNDPERIELVPNIIENPGYHGDRSRRDSQLESLMV